MPVALDTPPPRPPDMQIRPDNVVQGLRMLLAYIFALVLWLTQQFQRVNQSITSAVYWGPAPLTGTIDGVNVTFTTPLRFAVSPASGAPTVWIRFRGQLLWYTATNPPEPMRFTIVNNDIIMPEAPLPGDDLCIVLAALR